LLQEHGPSFARSPALDDTDGCRRNDATPLDLSHAARRRQPAPQSRHTVLSRTSCR